MRISVFGLGYVGTVTAACLADLGNEVVGVDVNADKVNIVNSGHSPIVEPHIDELVGSMVSQGRIRATTSVAEGIHGSDLSLVCVGTPSRANGSLDTGYLERVAGEIGEAIRGKNRFHSVVVRSTVLPGTVSNIVLPLLEKTTDGKVGERFGIALNPEFMREGSAVADFRDPPKTVIGEMDKVTGDLIEQMFSSLKAPLFRVPIEVAEMVKYTDNVWHALKVAFGNEIGSIAKSVGIDSHTLMKIFLSDTKLNISPAYLKPGFAFGGSCLPKDTRALSYFGRAQDLDLPIISNLISSNQKLIDRGIDWILSTGAKRICFLGFSFKAGTDDLRESPYLEMVERLIGKGKTISIYDRNVVLARLMGANKAYLYNTIPHVNELLVDSPAKALEEADLVVVTANSAEYAEALEHLRPDQRVLDFARIPDAAEKVERYEGFMW
jgi:GDP-mannose 6-dehydrogenase